MSEPHSAPAKDDRWVGRTLDEKYRLEALIGTGAMGRVYRGVDVSLHKPVAIKLLHDHLGGDPRIARRFHREAKAASRLSHPNSLSILDFGEARDGTLFIAMELLEGEDLQTIIDHDAPLSPRRIGELMGQALAALHEAHRAGIIHRDLKPENVVVVKEPSGRERVKVCDFGIAKIMESEGRSTAITKDGYVCGTPEYMAPEQAKGEPIDVRADVYAAGVMLYQLLCGRVPFKAETALGLITKHIMDAPPSPRSVAPTWGIPRSLERIALRALEKNKAARFEDAAAMAEALERAIAELGDDADCRLGHGPFESDGADADDVEERAAPARDEGPSTAEVIARAVPERRWRRAIVPLIALLVLGVAVGVWLGEATRPAVGPTASETLATTEPESETESAPPPARGRGSGGGSASESASEPESETESAPPPARGRGSGGGPASEAESDSASASEASSGTGSRRGRRGEPSAPADPGRAAYEEGRARLLRGELTQAIARLGEAARLRPSDAAVHRELGRAQVRAGQVASGIASYRRYLALAPDAPDRAVIERIIANHGLPAGE